MVEGAQEPTGKRGTGVRCSVRGSWSKPEHVKLAPEGKHHPRASPTAWNIVQGRRPVPDSCTSEKSTIRQGVQTDVTQPEEG